MPHELSTGSPPAEQEPHRKAAERRRVLRHAAIVVAACTLLSLPIVYLLVHRPPLVQAHVSNPVQVAPPQTAASLEELVRTSPNDENRINLSLAYIRENQPGRAIPVLDAVVAGNSNSAPAWNNLCVANTMQMALNDAIEECNRALRIAPDFQLARNNLKWAEDEKRKVIVAITAREQTPPGSRDAASYLAEGLDNLHIGSYDQSIKAWQRTLSLDPRNAAATNNIGIAYMLKKQPAVAIPWFEKAISLDPTMQLAKNNLAWAKDEEAKAGKAALSR
jgi:tetratricopeptide (TPR) repeat protein